MKFIKKLLLLAIIIMLAGGAFYLIPTRYLSQVIVMGTLIRPM